MEAHREFIMIQKNEDFSKRVRRLRIEAGLTQIHAAKKLGINLHQLARYEFGRSKPSFVILIKLADFYQVTLDYLAHGEDKKFSNRAEIHDKNLLELFRRVDRLKMAYRDRIRWTMESLLSNLPDEESGIKSAQDSPVHKIAKSA